jgi:DNA adenine methylase
VLASIRLAAGSAVIGHPATVDYIDRPVYVGSMSYLGSKAVSGAYQAIIAQMPPHDTYIETHLGTGIVMRKKPPAIWSIGIERDAELLERFQCGYKVELHNQDCLAWLKVFNFHMAGRVLIYADPPYLIETRSSQKRYRCDYTVDDHKRLLGFLSDIPAMVIISGYPSGLYEAWLRGWRRFEFQAMTRGGPRTEVIWMSFPGGGSHWASFAGVNFTDRQRIKRKATRWAANYRALPSGERTAILAALLEVHSDRASATRKP